MEMPRKRTMLVPNRNIIMSLDGVIPKSPVSVAMMPWDDPDPEPPPPPPPPPRVYNGK